MFNSSLSALNIKIYGDENKLLLANKKINPSELHWHLNAALLKQAEASTDDQELQTRTHFAAVNFLKKAAPPLMGYMRWLEPKMESRFQINPFADASYHREGFQQQISLGTEKINQHLAFRNSSPLVLTDRSDFAHLFPLHFTVIDEQNEHAHKLIGNAVVAYFRSWPTLNTGFEHTLRPGLLFDTTDLFRDMIHTDGCHEREQGFQGIFFEFKNKIAQLLKKSAQEIASTCPPLTPEQLEAFLQKNVTCVCRLDFEHCAGMKVLPLFSDLSGDHLPKVHKALIEFIDKTGTYINPLNLRRYLLEERAQTSVTYTGASHHALARYLPHKDTLTHMNVWTMLARTFDSGKIREQPHVRVLGQGTMALFQGLMTEISEQKWKALNSNPCTCQIIQNSFFKIANCLASAHLHIENFELFALDIELIHAEIATILEFAEPFKNEDFDGIYKNVIMDSVPEDLRSMVRAGLGKSAVNIFAGVNAALLHTTPFPTRTYSDNFYYEEAFIVNLKNKIEQIVANQEIKTVELFGGQFNANIQPQIGYTTYRHRDLAADIDALLKSKPATEHMTVAIDFSIDYVHSERNRQLLERFKDEIRSGRLNFVFFKSGQKTDMFGMDNYFGAPYYIVNNGAPYWKEFNDLPSKPLHQTDSLSIQWFCLSNKYAASYMDEYRRLIFAQSRTLIKALQQFFRPNPTNPQQRVYVCDIDDRTDTSFVDIRVQGGDQKTHRDTCDEIGRGLVRECERRGIKTQIRQSWGFYHCNLGWPFEEQDVSVIRLNPSLDPHENDVILDYFRTLASTEGTVL
jgi:hypothetical protein